METETSISRGRKWFTLLAGESGANRFGRGSVLMTESVLNREAVRFLAVVPDSMGRFPCARRGEVGLEEAWMLAKYVRQAVDMDQTGARRPIISIIDVPGQACGRREETLGIFMACSAAVDAYATARMLGHPIISLIVGQAISGAFLAHGHQANKIFALDAPGVTAHAMSKNATARILRRDVAELNRLAEVSLPMSYDIRSFAQLGLLNQLIPCGDADHPSDGDVEGVASVLAEAIAEIRGQPREFTKLLPSEVAFKTRSASLEVRRRLIEQWAADEESSLSM